MKLNAIILDNDKPALDVIRDYCQESKLVNVIETFRRPEEFLNASSQLKYDMCLLDINLPIIDGLTVVKTLNGKPFIFITASNDRLKEALDASPVDILSKPVNKERLDIALEKASALVAVKRNRLENRDYRFFTVKTGEFRVNLCSADIMYVSTDGDNPRNKLITMLSGEKYSILDCSLAELMDFSPSLVRISKAELVSIKAVHGIEYNKIILKGFLENGKPKQMIVTRTCRKRFLERLG